MFITRFTTVSNEVQDYYYHNAEDAEKHYTKHSIRMIEICQGSWTPL